MVSIRRRKLRGRSNGRSSFLVPPRSIADGSIAEKPEQNGRPVNKHHVASVGHGKSAEVKEEERIIESPPAKRQKIHCEIDADKPREVKQKIHLKIDPENPMEVHAYLMKLKEDNKLELGPLHRSEEMSVKEWMEKRYPHIFRVFPQNPKVLVQLPDKSKQNEFLYCHYWLFLFEVRNIVLMDYNVSPDYVESLGKVIKTLEMHGFDCRFMRSEMFMVGNMLKQRQEIMLAERNLIAKRTVNLEKELQDMVRKNGKEDVEKREKQMEEVTCEMEMQEEQHKGEGELNKLPCTILDQEFVEAILKRHRKMLACKEEEGKRLDQVVEKINQLHRNKASFF